MGQKEGRAAVSLSGGKGFRGAGSPSNTMWPGKRSTSVQSSILIYPAVWHNSHGPKSGGAMPLLGAAGSPSNIMSLGRGLPPYQVAS